VSTFPVLPGAEAFSAPGGPDGVLVLHGFTGCPQSMRGLAEAFAATGLAVELPRLPGHGTSLEEMKDTRWSDWSATVEATYAELASRCGRVVVAGLSMGGTLATWVAANHPEVAGLIAINAAIEPAGPEIADLMKGMLAGGTEISAGIGNDVADPAETELAYDGFPVASLISLLEAQDALAPILSEIRCPTLIVTSRNDHVVQPSNSDFLAAAVSGPVERVWLERSFHVATLDYDKDEIESRAVDFARKVTSTA